MNRTVYVNGEFVAEDEARVSVFDRGFLFADAVYEVAAVLEGKLVDNPAHLARLHRSLDELAIAAPLDDAQIVAVEKELIERNGLREGVVYLQVTRGVADREFTYPRQARPGLVMFTQLKAIIDNPAARDGIRVISVPDIRWRRRDIKTVGLLAACMARQSAAQAGVNDAWLVEDGYVTEGSSNNAAIVTAGGALVTRPLSNAILHGITRAALLEISRRDGVVIEERMFTLEEAYAAVEAFISSASTFVWPVVEIDGRAIGDGRPGALTRRLRELYIEQARARAT